MNFKLDDVVFVVVWVFIVAEFVRMLRLCCRICNNSLSPEQAEKLDFSLLSNLHLPFINIALLCFLQWWFTAVCYLSTACCWVLLKSAVIRFYSEDA